MNVPSLILPSHGIFLGLGLGLGVRLGLGLGSPCTSLHFSRLTLLHVDTPTFLGEKPTFFDEVPTKLDFPTQGQGRIDEMPTKCFKLCYVFYF